MVQRDGMAVPYGAWDGMVVPYGACDRMAVPYDTWDGMAVPYSAWVGPFGAPWDTGNHWQDWTTLKWPPQPPTATLASTLHCV